LRMLQEQNFERVGERRAFGSMYASSQPPIATWSKPSHGEDFAKISTTDSV
jgi:hypothetical protein